MKIVCKMDATARGVNRYFSTDLIGTLCTLAGECDLLPDETSNGGLTAAGTAHDFLFSVHFCGELSHLSCDHSVIAVRILGLGADTLVVNTASGFLLW